MALTESIANEAATTLNGAITAGATSITVASSTGFPPVPFRARVSGALTAGGVGVEYLRVTAVSGTTWTVTRGAEAPYSTGLGFASGAVVKQVVTAAALTPALRAATLDVFCANSSGDAALIQAAIDGSSAGDVIRVHGPASITATILLRDDRHYVFNAASGGVLQQAAGANLDAVVATKSWWDNVTSTNVGITVTGLGIDGNKANQTGGAGHGLVLRSFNSTYQDIRVKNTRGDGIRITNESRNNTLLSGTSVNCTIRDFFVTDAAGSGVRCVDGGNAITDWTLRDGWVAVSGVHGIRLDNSAGWAVQNNHVYTTQQHAIDLQRCFGTRVIGNYVEDFGLQGSAVTYYGLRAALQGDASTTIVGNAVHHFGALAAGMTAAQYIRVEGNYDVPVCTVAGNTVRGAGDTRETGLSFAVGSATTARYTSSGNQVFKIGGSRQSVGAGVQLEEGGPFVNARDFGARGDAVTRNAAGSMTSGSAVLTDAGGSFTAYDVGKMIAVSGAGAGTAQLTTTIAGYTSATQVTLAVAAGTTVTNNNYTYGTDNAAAINAAITYAAGQGVTTAGTGSSSNGLTGGTVFIGPGVFLHTATIAVKSRVRLIGAGRDATTLRRVTDVVSVSFYGTGTADANRIWYAGLEHLTVDGNDRWVTAVDCVYASQLIFFGVFILNSHGIGLDLVEVWDSKFYALWLQFCAGIGVTEQPAIYVRSTRAASGFGSSTDTINECRFTDVHIEHFRAGAIKIGPGLPGATNGPNGIYFDGIKTESAFISNTTPFIEIAPNTERVHIQRVYAYAASFQDGSAVPIVQNNSLGQVSIRDIQVANGGVATVTAAVAVNTTSGSIALDEIYGIYTTAPTVAHINVSSAATLEISPNVKTNIGTLISGWELNGDLRAKTITADITTTATAAAQVTEFTFTNVQPGTYQFRLDGAWQSSITTGGSRFGVGGGATASFAQGMLWLANAATGGGNSTLMTAKDTTFGTGNAGATATPYPVTIWFTIVVTAAGTVGLRWNGSAAGTQTLRAGTTATLTRIR